MHHPVPLELQQQVINYALDAFDGNPDTHSSKSRRRLLAGSWMRNVNTFSCVSRAWRAEVQRLMGGKMVDVAVLRRYGSSHLASWVTDVLVDWGEKEEAEEDEDEMESWDRNDDEDSEDDSEDEEDGARRDDILDVLPRLAGERVVRLAVHGSGRLEFLQRLFRTLPLLPNTRHISIFIRGLRWSFGSLALDRMFTACPVIEHMETSLPWFIPVSPLKPPPSLAQISSVTLQTRRLKKDVELWQSGPPPYQLLRWVQCETLSRVIMAVGVGDACGSHLWTALAQAKGLRDLRIRVVTGRNPEHLATLLAATVPRWPQIRRLEVLYEEGEGDIDGAMFYGNRTVLSRRLSTGSWASLADALPEAVEFVALSFKLSSSEQMGSFLRARAGSPLKTVWWRDGNCEGKEYFRARRTSVGGWTVVKGSRSLPDRGFDGNTSRVQLGDL